MVRGIWARRILISLFSAHGAALLFQAWSGNLDIGADYLLAVLGFLNLSALAGLASRTRIGWFLALVFVSAAVGRYAWTMGLEGVSGLLLLCGIAAAILCVTDENLRAEHGVASPERI